MSEGPRQHPPFKESLKRSDVEGSSGVQGERLEQIGQDDRFIVRWIPFTTIEDSHGKTPLFKNIIEVAEKAKELFDELRERYNINAPVNITIGVNREEIPVIYMITDRIEHAVFESLGTEQKNEMVTELRNMYDTVLRYYEDKLTERGYCLNDLMSVERQFVYGKKIGDENNKLYLVDTDPWISNLAIPENRHGIAHRMWVMRISLGSLDKYGVDTSEFTERTRRIEEIATAEP